MGIVLEEYNQKRNFDKTQEPEGIPQGPEEGLRFVVQHHIARKDHYDFRLEWEGVLLSWAVPKGPSYNTNDKRLAIKVEDHPLDYRHFEGTIPKGEYGGGVVMLWDEGYWEPILPVDEGLAKGMLKFRLKGKRLMGRWALVRLQKGEENHWLLLKEKDEYAKEEDGISGFATSIRTGRTMEQIEQGEAAAYTKNPFVETKVQLAKLVKEVPAEGDWLYELKYDGYRIVAYVEGSSVRLMSRNGNDYTGRFWEVVHSLLDLSRGRAMVLDGEMTVIDSSGKTDFQALQKYLKNPGKENLVYIVFDLLALDGKDLRNTTLENRKKLLQELLQDAPPKLFYSQHVLGSGKESFAAACELGMEGIVGKKADSIYSGTRNGDWIKLKCDKRQHFVIGGYTLTSKKSSGISALLLGLYEGEELIYVGRAGTGISQEKMKELERQFEALKCQESHFQNPPKQKANEIITWLVPKLVAEIKFAEWTNDNLLRQASFKGLSSGIDPKELQRELFAAEEEEHSIEEEQQEQPMQQDSKNIYVLGVKITNKDKVIFENPVITKEDVVRYYERVAQRMLPYTRKRILSIVRCPKGISSNCFYKKHPNSDSAGIVTFPVTNSSGETDEYFYIEDVTGLISEAQMGTLEFHTWGSRVDRLEQPDIMVFDLDPDEGMDLQNIRQGVLDMKEILTELSLKSYLKTSGGKGYHVVVPLKPEASWEVFNEFARQVAQVMELKWPDRYTSNVRKAKRANKIFIDWIRNGRGATSIAPYSIRAREGAAVSMPIFWEELATIAPDGIKMEDALKRVEQEDPWKHFFEEDQRLS